MDKERIKNIKKNIVNVAYKNWTGHTPSSLSSVEIYYVLYNKIANINKKNIGDKNRDRIIISKEHSRLAQVSVLVENGLLDKKYLDTFITNNGTLGHDIYNLVGGDDIKAVDYASGSLGHGPSVAAGLAYDSLYNVYVIVGDGELQEGSCWEAILFAGQNCLKNFTLIVDRNFVQIEDFTKNILDSSKDVGEKIKLFGFDIFECDGHNIEELENVLKIETQKPKCIVANTIKAKETLFIRDRIGHAFHHWRTYEQEDITRILQEIDNE